MISVITPTFQEVCGHKALVTILLLYPCPAIPVCLNFFHHLLSGQVDKSLIFCQELMQGNETLPLWLSLDGPGRLS